MSLPPATAAYREAECWYYAKHYANNNADSIFVVALAFSREYKNCF